MPSAIIGHTGYVGSYLKTKIDGICDYYNSKNIDQIAGREYDTIYFAGLPAAKWIANKDPDEDLQNLNSILILLEQCIARRFILISTIDVYNKSVVKQDEHGTFFTDEPYGKHRRMMEEWVIQKYENHCILRLPALFGAGLKKNILYDLIKNKSCVVDPADTFQWYNLNNLYFDMQMCLELELKITNLFSEPIKMADIIERFFPDAEITKKIKPIVYDYESSYRLYSKKSILYDMNEFIKMSKADATKLVCSNLCWKTEHQKKALYTLKRYGIENVELAVTKHFSWNDKELIEKTKEIYHGFNIYSLQSLFYGIDCNLFVNPILFIAHFKHVISIANELGAKRLVFGSPSVRMKPEELKGEDAFAMFAHIMKKIAEYLPNDMVICIEHNASDYGCNFMTKIADVLHVLDLIDHPNVKLNYDTGNATMMNDSCEPAVDSIGHVQLSAPFLNDIESTPTFDKKAYDGKISLETKESLQFEDNLHKLLLFGF